MQLTDQQLGWRHLLACPDCRAPLHELDAGLVCSLCGRQFISTGELVDLLPAGMASPESHYISGLDRSWRRRFIEHIYARHNLAPCVQDAVSRVVAKLEGDGGWGLNLGSGNSQLHPRLINLDISNNLGVHLLGDAHRLPLADNSLACVLSQEVIEHLLSPQQAIREAFRVLRHGGELFVQVPFIIGTHSLPHDYWRFTAGGLAELITSCGFEVLECRAAGGAGTSLYRVGTEFVATVAASAVRQAYSPAKAAAALLLSPLRWFDRFTTTDLELNRIPSGVYCIARKTDR